MLLRAPARARWEKGGHIHEHRFTENCVFPWVWVLRRPETHEVVVCLGELSEEQKVELERNLSRLECQEREANLLREKLSRMSSLVEKKDRALKAAAEELRYVLP